MSYYKIFISAGDTSGDIHGANLMACLLEKNPYIKFYGLGKEHMARMGLHCLYDMSNKSLMWLHILTELSHFLHMKKTCVRFFQREKPNAVVLIDYCGFNFHLAKAAKKLKIPVIYYICPQLWAHGPWRVKKLKKLTEKLIVIYPFERPFYEKAGIPAVYVGHPLFDEIRKEFQKVEKQSLIQKKSGETVISLLPGSRKQEIEKLLPIMLLAVKHIQRKVPSVQILISASNEQYSDHIRHITKTSNVPFKIIVGKTGNVINSSDLCIAGAGTITLQIAYYLKPMIIVYKISPFAYFIAQPFLTTPYIGLVNKLANKMIVPEILLYRKNHTWVANRTLKLLHDKQERELCIQELHSLINTFGKPGASQLAADEIVKMLPLH